ncbi:hypothetical protein WS98_25445 [Burkholderia territorii]|uniref:hypothetical protein n=1 Tax=Burkholderia territorii TaxID=1503055 RepID=UPI00075E0D7D|nr:hypothetical protein [Burkholderia territorii]KVL29773.1 hypothetical protein WS98_25445 [Burkholderia territorii]
MLNWDDELQLSRFEVEKARRLVVAPLDDAIAHTDHLLLEVYRLNASPERARLIDRLLALREERLAIKRERLAQLDRLLPENARVVPVRAGDLTAALNRDDFGDYKVIRRNGRVVSFEPHKVAIAVQRAFLQVNTPRRSCGFRFARTRGLSFVGSMLKRKAASRLVSCCGQHVRPPQAHPFHSRSTASRSRMLAPVGAPPSDC